jgi:hypothetical protein
MSESLMTLAASAWGDVLLSLRSPARPVSPLVGGDPCCRWRRSKKVDESVHGTQKWTGVFAHLGALDEDQAKHGDDQDPNQTRELTGLTLLVL